MARHERPRLAVVGALQIPGAQGVGAVVAAVAQGVVGDADEAGGPQVDAEPGGGHVLGPQLRGHHAHQLRGVALGDGGGGDGDQPRRVGVAPLAREALGGDPGEDAAAVGADGGGAGELDGDAVGLALLQAGLQDAGDGGGVLVLLHAVDEGLDDEVLGDQGVGDGAPQVAHGHVDPAHGAQREGGVALEGLLEGGGREGGEVERIVGVGRGGFGGFGCW